MCFLPNFTRRFCPKYQTSRSDPRHHTKPHEVFGEAIPNFTKLLGAFLPCPTKLHAGLPKATMVFFSMGEGEWWSQKPAFFSSYTLACGYCDLASVRVFRKICLNLYI